MKYLVLLPFLLLLCSCGQDTRPTPEQLGSQADIEMQHIREHVVPSEDGAILIVYHKPSTTDAKPWAEWRWVGDRTETENLMQAIVTKLKAEDPHAPVAVAPAPAPAPLPPATDGHTHIIMPPVPAEPPKVEPAKPDPETTAIPAVPETKPSTPVTP